MRIISLTAENIKRLTAVEIRPDGALVEITGKNGAGKTSVLDAIWWALAGTRTLQMQPIRRGCESGLIRLDLGELRVTRTFKAKEDGDYTTTLKVEKENGAAMSSPQDVLNAIVGELSFDPLEFTDKDAKGQFNALRRFVPDVDFDAIDAANKQDFETRTVAKRRAGELRAQADGIALPAGKVPAFVDVVALEDHLSKAAEHNVQIEQRKARREQTEELARQREYDALRRRNQAAVLIGEAEAGEIEAKGLREQIDKAEPLPAAIDVAEVQEKLRQARDGNGVAERAKRKADLAAQAVAAEEEASGLTKAIEARRGQIATAVAAAEMPVKGLAFGDGFVILNGVPFDQASDAQQLQASIAIAGAMNPRLRVIRVRDGSRLDEDAMKALAAHAEANDLQVWIERVDSTGKVGFVLENGHLKDEGPAEEEPI